MVLRESNIVTRSFTATMLLIIAVVSIINVANTTTPALLKVAWSATILFVCLATAMMIVLRHRKAAVALIGAAGAFGLFALLLYTNVVQYCGDNICTKNECASGCHDCSPGQCSNRICEPPIEDCESSNDCRCPAGYTCSPRRPTNQSDARGCVPVMCGDGYCDPPEASNTCCDDCNCPADERCQGHACFFIPPTVNINTRMHTRTIGATSLAGNHLLTNESGEPHPLIGILLKSSGTLRDAHMEFSIGGMAVTDVPMGDVPPNAETPVLWYVPYEPRLLGIDQDTTLNLTARALYKDAHGNNRSSAWIFPITVLGRNRVDDYGSIALYVTHDIETAADTLDGIWAELRGKVTAENRSGEGTILFPQETLLRGGGTRDDVALLLASAYDAKGLAPSLVQGPQGIFVRVRYGSRYVIIDPALLDKDFRDAMVQRPGYSVYDVQRIRYERNFTLLSLNRSMIPGANMRTTTAVDTVCPCDTACWTRAVATHAITNDGEVTAGLCARSTLRSTDGKVLDTRDVCYSIAPNTTVYLHHGWRNTIGCIDVKADITLRT
jgi:hypothetical protein